jgi:phage tail sheath protein FI
LASLAASDYIGDAAAANGLHAFDSVEGVALIAVPEAVDRAVHVGGMAYCETRGDCFYIGFSQERPDTANDVISYKSAQGAFSGGNAINSTYGALYTPWIQVFDPRTGGRTAIPPCGAVAGRYAAVDAARGAHKVAAGITDGKIATALGVTTDFAFADQAKLNPKGINVIRTIRGTGTVIWGARTVSGDPEWRYLNVRRLFLYLRGSIDGGTRWVVFEPNDRSLWNSIVRNVTAFLMLSWRDGALVGATPEQAFYVKCDEETNPQESIDLGRVVTEIGVAPSKPAEFVVFRISQM